MLRNGLLAKACLSIFISEYLHTCLSIYIHYMSECLHTNTQIWMTCSILGHTLHIGWTLETVWQHSPFCNTTSECLTTLSVLQHNFRVFDNTLYFATQLQSVWQHSPYRNTTPLHTSSNPCLRSFFQRACLVAQVKTLTSGKCCSTRHVLEICGHCHVCAGVYVLINTLDRHVLEICGHCHVCAGVYVLINTLDRHVLEICGHCHVCAGVLDNKTCLLCVDQDIDTHTNVTMSTDV